MTESEENILDEIIGSLPYAGPVDLASRLGLSVGFAAWHPATAGELAYKKKEITVNRNAKIPAERVIAHELGHFFVRERKIHVADEESFCDRFAEKLLKSQSVL